MSRSATPGSAAIISVMRYGGRDRNLGMSDGAHGSGADGSAAAVSGNSHRIGMRRLRWSATSMARS